MADFVRNLKSDGKRARPYILLAAMLDFGERLLEHRLLGAINDFIDAHSGPILDAFRPILIWLVHTPFVLLIFTVCVILLHACFSSHHNPQHTKTPTDSPSSGEQTINMKQEANPQIEVNPQFHIYPSLEQPKAHDTIQRTKTCEQVSKPPSHNIVFLGGHRYAPNKHGLLEGPRESDMMRLALAEFRNKYIVGRPVGHAYNVRAGITYSDDNGTELLYVSPGEWLRHDTETVELKCGAESEFVVLAAYNYTEKRWETHKMIETQTWQGSSYSNEPRPLPFSNVTAMVVLLDKGGNALECGTVTLELKANGDFEIR